MIHDGLSVVERNKSRQCFDADPGRGEPKLKSAVADLHSILTSHKLSNPLQGIGRKIARDQRLWILGGQDRQEGVRDTRNKQRLQAPRCLYSAGGRPTSACTASIQHCLDNSDGSIKHKDENEVLLTFLYFTSSPSPEHNQHEAPVPPEGHLRISFARSISSS